MSRWCDEEILLFLELYEQQPCLWNPAFLGYRDNEIRLQAIRWILSKMGKEGRMTEYDVKCKIKNIRTTYMRNLRKLLKKGQGEFTPTLWFWKADSFLRSDGEVSIFKKEQRKTIKGTGIGCSSIFAGDSEDDPCELDSDQDSQGGTGQPKMHPESSLPSLSTVCRPQRKKRHVVEDEEESEKPPSEENGLTLDEDSLRIYIRDAQRQLERLEARRKVCVKKEMVDTPPRGVGYEHNDDTSTHQELAGATEGDFDVFARLVGSQLRQLPLVRALKCQQEIHSLLMRERIEHVIQQNGSQVVTTDILPRSMVVPNRVTETDTMCFSLNCLAD